jgi:hypothetical protein
MPHKTVAQPVPPTHTQFLTLPFVFGCLVFLLFCRRSFVVLFVVLLLFLLFLFLVPPPSDDPEDEPEPEPEEEQAAFITVVNLMAGETPPECTKRRTRSVIAWTNPVGR